LARFGYAGAVGGLGRHSGRRRSEIVPATAFPADLVAHLVAHFVEISLISNEAAIKAATKALEVGSGFPLLGVTARALAGFGWLLDVDRFRTNLDANRIITR
jgi:hypothetical protein